MNPSHPRSANRRLCAFVAALAAAAGALPLAAQESESADSAATPAYTREYLQSQPADTALVFRFESFEAEFESRIAEAGKTPFKVSGVPDLRIGPVFQFVDPVTKPRELTIDVALGRRSARARLEMQLLRFDPSGPDQPLQQQSYRLLSYGLETAPAGRTDLWQDKIVALLQAAAGFDRLGMQEPMLWSGFYAAHFMLERLGDARTAAENARDLESAARQSRHHRVLLAARQLEGRALLALATAERGAATYDRAREVFAQAAAQAAEMDFQYEQALALFRIGLADEHQGRHDNAFGRFDEALEIAALARDVDFANAVRRHAAGLHERLGHTDAAIAMMQRIETPAPPTTAATGTAATPAAGDASRNDSVGYLYEQGRLLEKADRHTEAIDVLRRALSLVPGESPGTAAGPIGVLLGKALFESGRFDEAQEQLVDAIPGTPAAGHAKALFEAWGILATIRRHRGEWDAATASREQQAKFTGTAADEAWLAYERGVDAQAAGQRGAARNAFAASRRAAAATGAADLAALSRLRLCALDGGSDCESAAADTVGASDPATRLETRWLQVLVWRHLGRDGDAEAGSEALLNDVLGYHSRAPEALGAWYWLRRDTVFETFLALRTARYGRGAATARLTLAALDALRAPARAGAGTTLTAHDRSLRDQLDSLAPTESLVAWFVGRDAAYAWLGQRGSIELLPMRWDADVRTGLATTVGALRQTATDGGGADLDSALVQLGELLLHPLPASLGDVVLFLPLGPLEGLPLGALDWNGQPLAATRRVVNLRSLAGLANRTPQLSLTPAAGVFLAGNRQRNAGDFALTTPPSAEIDALADRFVGPGLTLRRGAALQWDEFQDPRFTAATLLHLAMPAVEDLADPAGSHLLMSDNADDPAHVRLRAAELPASLHARLAVLSQCRFVGTPASSLSRGGGLVDALLGKGSAAVIASLWPVGDAAAADFMQRFYDRLAHTPAIDRALAETRRSYIEDGASPVQWAAFQLFVD